MKRIYQIKLIFRIILLGTALYFYFSSPKFLMIENTKALHSPVALVIWVCLLIELISRFFPNKKLGMGCQKEFKKNYMERPYGFREIKEERKVQNRRAAILAVIWTIVHVIIGSCYLAGVIRSCELVILTLLYHVGDMVCVLFWCPFQTIFMKNRCCTVCRIYAWDAVFLVSPLIFIPGIMSRSLLAAALYITLRWEYRYIKYPERFFECSNKALSCSECTNHLCYDKKKIKKALNAIKRI